MVAAAGTDGGAGENPLGALGAAILFHDTRTGSVKGDPDGMYLPDVGLLNPDPCVVITKNTNLMPEPSRPHLMSFILFDEFS
jgi:hypothetical protein